jgi:hypothetical protein
MANGGLGSREYRQHFELVIDCDTGHVVVMTVLKNLGSATNMAMIVFYPLVKILAGA